MRPRRNNTNTRRAVALAVAYVLALQGLLAVWGMVATAAYAADALPSILCAPGGTSEPGQRPGDLPPCCPCGPLCAANVAPALPGSPKVDGFVVRRWFLPVDGWLKPQRAAVPGISFDPRKARAPPTLA